MCVCYTHSNIEMILTFFCLSAFQQYIEYICVCVCVCVERQKGLYMYTHIYMYIYIMCVCVYKMTKLPQLPSGAHWAEELISLIVYLSLLTRVTPHG